MPFQKEVHSDMCPGLPGASAGAEPAISITRQAGEAITIGRAVWPKPGDDTTVMASGTGPVAGIAMLTKTGTITGHLAEATDVIQVGEAISILERGPLFAVLTNNAVAKQAVYANTANGSLKADDAGQTVAGHVETKFTVRRGGTAGSIVTITSW